MAKSAKPLSELDQLLAELKSIVERLPGAAVVVNKGEAKRAWQALEKTATRFAEMVEHIDPIKRPKSIFDLSNPEIVGRVIALTLIAQERLPLANTAKFYGSGIYAIYYNGDFSPYLMLSKTEHPIYVGKADPDSPGAKDPVSQGPKLAGRLNDHRRSISKAATLNIGDFDCRFLVVQSGWQAAAERYLINLFRPIWNSEVNICYGIGKHGDVGRQHPNSPWDTLHPARDWANNNIKGDQKPPEQIILEIQEHLATNSPYTDRHQLFDRFMLDMRQLPATPKEK